MKSNPPHILITNYAMVEYLLLRPADSVFFHGENATKWKFIVLDEAHTYSGATGIEVAMLLRRLKYTLTNHNRIQFILTSATLGDKSDNSAICAFASDLCTAGVQFDENSIVRAHRYYKFDITQAKEYNSNIYKVINQHLSNGATKSELLAQLQNFDERFKSSANSIGELLYDFLIQDRFYFRMRKILSSTPVTINKITEELGVSENDIVDFVTIARKAIKGNIMLFDAKYHMFVRALEGAYIVLGKQKSLTILPSDNVYIDDSAYKCYKIAVCQNCGHIYIEAKIENSFLVQRKEKKRK